MAAAFTFAEIEGRKSLKMSIEFDVKMSTKKLYDYLLYHTYTSFSGMLGVFIGFCFFLLFVLKANYLYLAASIVVLAYLPVSLYTRAKRQMLLTKAFKDPLHYKLTEEGVEISQGEIREFQAWKDMYKAVSTGKSIIVYTGRINASIFPKEDLGNKKQEVVAAISTHMDPKKVKIRRV